MTRGTPEDNAREIVSLKDRLAALEKAVETKADLLPVGTVLLSPLTLAQFQQVYGSGWVKLEQKYPAARGRYFRLARFDSELATTQEDATAPKGMSLTVDYIPGKIKGRKPVSGTVKNGHAHLKMWEANTPAVPGDVWRFFHRPASQIKSVEGHCIFGSGSLSEGRLYGGHGEQKIFTDNGHDHTFSGSVDLDENVTGSSVSCSLKSQDYETRPKSFLLNAFIRIS